MMEELMAQFSTAIKANPEQYFWYNKRWVLDPL
jgi:lauroyl/myristoyl acyltransferase